MSLGSRDNRLWIKTAWGKPPLRNLSFPGFPVTMPYRARSTQHPRAAPRHLGMLQSMREDECRTDANTALLPVTDPSTHGPGCPQGSWNQSPAGIEGQTQALLTKAPPPALQPSHSGNSLTVITSAVPTGPNWKDSTPDYLGPTLQSPRALRGRSPGQAATAATCSQRRQEP